MKRRYLISILILSIAVFSGCKKEQVAFVMDPPTVTVMKVEKGLVPLYYTYIGQVAGSQAVEVRAQVSGILVSRNYKEGDYVTEGQVLFNIEPSTYNATANQARAMLKQAEAKYVQAKQNYERVNYLFAEAAVSQSEYDNAKAAFDVANADVLSAKASLQDASVKLQYTQVTAPISGYTSKENFTIGNLISANSADSNLLTVINKTDNVFVYINMPENDYRQLKKWSIEGLLEESNIYATAKLQDGTTYKQKGKIIFTDRQINQKTASVAVKIEFDNPDFSLIPGEYLNITIEGYKLKDSIVVPQRVLLQSQTTNKVVVVGEDNKANFIDVKLGADIVGGLIIIEGGLQGGEKIIFEGTNKARQSQPVSIVATEESPLDSRK